MEDVTAVHHVSGSSLSIYTPFLLLFLYTADYTSSSSRYTHSPTPHSIGSSHSSLSCTSYSSGTSGRSPSVTPMDNPHRREDTTSQKSDLFDEPEQVKEKPRQQPPPCQSRETPISEGGKKKSREGK